jgi:peptidyl-prolyl cis-trans isomerase SurA
LHALGALTLALACIMPTFAVHAQGGPSPREADRILVLVNAEPITSADLRARLALIQPPPGGSLPPPDELARQVLEQLILEQTQIQWAMQTGIRVDDASVDDAEAQVARQNGLSVEQLHQRLRAMGTSPTAFRANLRNDILLQRARARGIESRTRITERDIDAYLQEQAALAAPNQTALHLAQILIAVPENADSSTRAALEARARELAQQARQGQDFAALAQQFSAGPEREAGGQMGLRTADRYPTLFLEAIRHLRRGDVTDPVRSGAGFHVLKVLEKRPLNLPEETLPETRARHILIRPTAQLDERNAAARLSEIRQQIVAGQISFADAARTFSQDGSAREGGELGWARAGMFVPEFEQVMNQLAPGDISTPFLSRFGVHLLQVVERRQVAKTVRERREWVRNRLREQRAEAAYEDWSRELRAQAFIEFRETDR